MALLPWEKAKVIAIQQVTYNTRVFVLQNETINNFDFKPGQFITLDLPIDEKPNKRLRSYSIASAPNGTNTLELLIVLNEHGAGTPYLFNQVNVGDELTYRGPVGVFTLPEVLEKPLYLICTGTGVAPFRSMIIDLLVNKKTNHAINLIYGCRTAEDLLYFDEMNALAAEYNSFQYYPILSREEMNGQQGYVHQIYQNLCKAVPEANFFLCGWKNMIDDARKNLTDIGYDKKNIHFELYG